MPDTTIVSKEYGIGLSTTESSGNSMPRYTQLYPMDSSSIVIKRDGVFGEYAGLLANLTNRVFNGYSDLYAVDFRRRTNIDVDNADSAYKTSCSILTLDIFTDTVLFFIDKYNGKVTGYLDLKDITAYAGGRLINISCEFTDIVSTTQAALKLIVTFSKLEK